MRIVKINAVWCPACIVSNKIWKNVLVDYPDLDIEELDLDFDSDEVKKYNVGDILPVVIFLNDEKEVFRLIGEKTKEEIYKAVEEYR
ncbi:MAG: thioredoxin family protein [Firmicutes bacterium]|nr:thioredoxin family protein [Bacillota bacterium]